RRGCLLWRATRFGIALRDRGSTARSLVEQSRKEVRSGACGVGLGSVLCDGIPPRGAVERHHRPGAAAVLTAQLDVEAVMVVFDAKPVCLVAVLVQDPSAPRVGDKKMSIGLRACAQITTLSPTFAEV
ncbi:MAG: hypothetical protein ACRDRL_02305, partial [Sciscionella sp.]